jgi:DNA-binding NtrC family response regulator
VQRLVVAPELSLPMSDVAQPESSADSAEAASRLEPLRVARRVAADAFEREYLRVLFKRSEGNVTRAAAVAEVSRQMIQKLMRKHGLS